MDDESADRSFTEPEAGPTWRQRAQLGALEAVLDPADTRGRKNRLIHRVHTRALNRTAGDVSGAIVLDFGCGTGRLSDWLNRRGANVEGVDATAEMVEVAEVNVPGVHFQAIGGPALPFADRHFDLVITAYVLQYYVQDMRIMSELVRVLKLGGEFIAIEQIAEDDALGRAGSVAAYEGMFREAGLRVIANSTIRLGDSRIVALAERLPVLARLPMVPWLVTMEARSREREPLTNGRYADAVFYATKAQA